MSDRTEAVITAQGLVKRFDRTTALRGVSLALAPGERVALFGPNGSGKTTLLKVLSGLAQPTRGALFLRGIEYRAARQDLRRSIGVVSHHTYLYDDLTGEENLLFYGRMFGIDNPVRRVDEALRRVGMEHRRKDRVRTLSRGMQQRLALARATLHNPTVLLLDEPDTGLDQEAASHLGSLLEIGDRGEGPTHSTHGGPAVLMATHNLRLGLALCDRFLILANGKQACEGHASDHDLASLEELYNRHAKAA